ncbi:MAG: TetR/AcrR family transcriptional regulator [Candidatus Eremiobacteraeota bacterium]|nr:TetR/AcrR family transcriptional regulator [Candidatus Eremiobacteraeota bacterium]
MGNRRQHIIELAAEVVYRQGFKGTSVENVLEIAGVGKGNFYHYFRSKDELGVAIIGEIEKWFNGPAGDDMFSPTKSPQQRLKDYLGHVAQQRRRDNRGDPLGNLSAELGDVEPFAKPLRRAVNSLLDRFEALVTEYALERGATVPARTIARQLVAQIHGLSALYKVDRDDDAFAEGLTRCEDILQSAVGFKAPATQSSSSLTRSE